MGDTGQIPHRTAESAADLRRLNVIGLRIENDVLRQKRCADDAWTGDFDDGRFAFVLQTGRRRLRNTADLDQ